MLGSTTSLSDKLGIYHGNKNHTLLCRVYDNNLELVSKLLEDGADPNASLIKLLDICARSNYVPIAKKLLEYGVDVHADNDYALRHGIECNHYEMIVLLLENGADLYCGERLIFKKLLTNFDEKLADIVLPYCCTNDFINFPETYARNKFQQPKSARTLN